jgi:hypothetical protein
MWDLGWGLLRWRGCGNLKSCLLPTPPHNHEIQKSLPNLFALYPLIRVSCKMKDVVILSPMEVTHRHSQSNQPRVCGWSQSFSSSWFCWGLIQGSLLSFSLAGHVHKAPWRTPAFMQLKTLFLLSYNFLFNWLHSFSIIQIHSFISIFGYTRSIIQIHSTTAIWNYGHSILCIHSNLHGCSAKNSSIRTSIHMKMHIMHVNVHNVSMLGYAAQHIY